MKTFAIEWNDSFTTVLWLNTRTRRSRRLRRTIRHARRGDLDAAWDSIVPKDRDDGEEVVDEEVVDE